MMSTCDFCPAMDGSSTPQLLAALDATCQKITGSSVGAGAWRRALESSSQMCPWAEFVEHLWSQWGVKVVMGKPSCCCGSDAGLFCFLKNVNIVIIRTEFEAAPCPCQPCQAQFLLSGADKLASPPMAQHKLMGRWGC